MIKIYKYKKVSTQYTMYTLKVGYSEDLTFKPVTELCTINDETYISVPNQVLPPQSDVIAATLVEVDLSLVPDIKQEILNISPSIKLIDEGVVRLIRERYTVNDELKLLRTSPSAAFDVYNEYVEECRLLGATQRASLGL